MLGGAFSVVHTGFRSPIHFFQARESKTPKSVSVELGTSAKKWAVSCAMPGDYFTKNSWTLLTKDCILDIKASVTEVINVEWVRKRAHPLLPCVLSPTFRTASNNQYGLILVKRYHFAGTEIVFLRPTLQI